ncbi:hypothetical protein [Serratia quinivorans]|uniref:hypothetical protein n=1 Tax=Serratia quinivorans TaxID=137545 RepID=UPI003982C1EC
MPQKKNEALPSGHKHYSALLGNAFQNFGLARSRQDIISKINQSPAEVKNNIMEFSLVLDAARAYHTPTDERVNAIEKDFITLLGKSNLTEKSGVAGSRSSASHKVFEKLKTRLQTILPPSTQALGKAIYAAQIDTLIAQYPQGEVGLRASIAQLDIQRQTNDHFLQTGKNRNPLDNYLNEIRLQCTKLDLLSQQQVVTGQASSIPAHTAPDAVRDTIGLTPSTPPTGAQDPAASNVSHGVQPDHLGGGIHITQNANNSLSGQQQEAVTEKALDLLGKMFHQNQRLIEALLGAYGGHSAADCVQQTCGTHRPHGALADNPQQVRDNRAPVHSRHIDNVNQGNSISGGRGPHGGDQVDSPKDHVVLTTPTPVSDGRPKVIRPFVGSVGSAQQPDTMNNRRLSGIDQRGKEAPASRADTHIAHHTDIHPIQGEVQSPRSSGVKTLSKIFGGIAPSYRDVASNGHHSAAGKKSHPVTSAEQNDNVVILRKPTGRKIVNPSVSPQQESPSFPPKVAELRQRFSVDENGDITSLQPKAMERPASTPPGKVILSAGSFYSASGFTAPDEDSKPQAEHNANKN